MEINASLIFAMIIMIIVGYAVGELRRREYL